MNNENIQVMQVPLEDIIPNRFQPRLAFNERELMDLASSIKIHGIIQPLVLRRLGDKYEIIAGERRYKASIIAGLTSVPAIIKTTNDNESAELALVENVQRKDLNAMEEAHSYRKLLDRGMTQEEIAKQIGVTQSTVANKIRLLNLPKPVQEALLNAKISERHARSILTITGESEQLLLLNKIINERLTVKQTEDEIQRLLGKGSIPQVEPRIVPQQEYQRTPLKSPIPKTENSFPELKETISEVKAPMSPFEDIIKRDDDNDIKLDNPAASIFNSSSGQSTLVQEFINEKGGFNAPSEKRGISDAISSTRRLSEDLKGKGLDVNLEEFDFEDMYQIIIKIKKD